MSRLVLLTLLLLPLAGLADAIYRTTDAQGNVVFTDTPPANGAPADRVEIQPVNTAEPPQNLTRPAPADASNVESKVGAYTVTITEPANETSFPMGPGNFSVSIKVNPALNKDESLQLFMDDAPWGDPQRDSTWDLTNVFRGQHDLTVGVIDKSGKALAISPPVRVFVHRPSVNFNNKPKPQPK
jgi:hypothetical protein